MGIGEKELTIHRMCREEKATISSEPQSGIQRLERLAIEQYRKELCEEQGRPISFEEAKELWEKHRATEWRAKWMREFLARQREEILKHKWIESEKAQRDLGSEAVFDWINRYAAKWRAAYEQEQEQRLRSSITPSTS